MKNQKNKPMSDWSKIIVETTEKHPKAIATITANDFDMAEGYRARITPVYEN